MPANILEIVQVIRRMRGGSQAFLVRASNGSSYVTKFKGNPQGSRSLINEFIAGRLLAGLGVTTPDLDILALNNSCAGREQLFFQTETREPVANGLHLGSKCPADPSAVTIFDFLPSKFHSRLQNVRDLGTVFAFDQWTSNLDIRQYIYIRCGKDNVKLSSNGTKSGSALFTAWAIDHGMCFNKDWRFPPISVRAQKSLSSPFALRSLEEGIRCAESIQALPDSVFVTASGEVPGEWFGPGDVNRLRAVGVELRRRRDALPTILQKIALEGAAAI